MEIVTVRKRGSAPTGVTVANRPEMAGWLRSRWQGTFLDALKALPPGGGHSWHWTLRFHWLSDYEYLALSRLIAREMLRFLPEGFRIPESSRLWVQDGHPWLLDAAKKELDIHYPPTRGENRPAPAAIKQAIWGAWRYSHDEPYPDFLMAGETFCYTVGQALMQFPGPGVWAEEQRTFGLWAMADIVIRIIENHGGKLCGS